MKCNVNYLKTDVVSDQETKKTTATVVFRINISDALTNDKFVYTYDYILRFDNVAKFIKSYGNVKFDENFKVVIDFEMSASATAHGSDVYDPEVGKHIALSKVQEKVMLFTANFYEGLFRSIINQFTKLPTYRDNALFNAYVEYAHHQKLGGGNVIDLNDNDCDESAKFESVKNYFDGITKINGNIRKVKTV